MESKPSHISGFRLLKRLGAGSFGEIYLAINDKTKMQVAIKMELIQTSTNNLELEYKLYTYLSKDELAKKRGIPHIYSLSSSGVYNIMIMDQLGPSLESLYQFCDKKFSLKTVLMIIKQLIQRLQFLHSQGFIHRYLSFLQSLRDIKPDNFLLGAAKNSYKIYMIDLGLCKRYKKDGEHMPYKDGKGLSGTIRYISMNVHKGIEPSRRDDMESIGYLGVYFLKGLPWQGAKTDNTGTKHVKVGQVKRETSVEDLCEGLPQEFGAYINYCRNLKFDEEPQYMILQKMFYDLFKREGYVEDYVYDWNIKARDYAEEKYADVAEFIKQYPPKELKKY